MPKAARVGTRTLTAAGMVCSLFLMLAACGAPAPITSAPSESPTSSPTDAASSTPTTLGPVERPLDAGTYRLDLNQLASGGTEFPAFLANVPDGWHTIDGWILNRPRSGEDIPPVAVQFWDVTRSMGTRVNGAGHFSSPDQLSKTWRRRWSTSRCETRRSRST